MKSAGIKKDPIHFYHFKLDKTTLKRLVAAFPGEKKRNPSALAARVFKMLYTFLEKEHFSAREKETRYGLISSDPEDPRLSVHAPTPCWLYRRLKQIHQDLNVYSMAQLARKIIHIFLNLKEQFGDALEDYLAKVRHSWEKVKARVKKKGGVIRKIMPPKRWRGKQVILKSFYDNFSAVREILLC